jgi:O-acetyl-ADP-ribose deacetylase (regulator of RNase III)
MDAGWTGPPFDPLALADLLDLRVVGRSDIRDARIVPVGRDQFQIEFNPNRPPARVRYSVAHEIAHTLFPDCAEEIRNRSAPGEVQGDEWQLEALCNIAAAEFLMPIGSLPHFNGEELSIDRLMAIRKDYQVSAEALLIRAARLATEPCAVFCATRLEDGVNAGRYRLDYSIPSPSWPEELPKNLLLPRGTRVQECTAIGYTAKTREVWEKAFGEHYLECVGISPYPGASYPRVVGLLRHEGAGLRKDGITYLVGDATKPRGEDPKIIAHVVNDKTPRWGAGFAAALRSRHDSVQREFIEWVEADRTRLKLGHVHESTIDATCSVIHMIAQRGYGESTTPRIRYRALRECLEAVAIRSQELGASVHMPRIGAGQAGGRWELIEELITSTLGTAGIPVFVYDLPGQKPREPVQVGLDLN